MNEELYNLINQLCTEWGFCIPTTKAAKIMELDNLEADEFACAILEAEGMNPETEIEWRRKIKNKFTEAYSSKRS